MRKVGDLMAELGFKKEGSDDVKRAFIESLVRAAYGNNPPRSLIQKPKPSLNEPEQLAFNLENSDPNRAKVS